MKVRPNSSAGHSERGGVIYYFCSTGCKRQFDADPDRYLNAAAFGAPEPALVQIGPSMLTLEARPVANMIPPLVDADLVKP